jgi:hypothetical protein
MEHGRKTLTLIGLAALLVAGLTAAALTLVFTPAPPAVIPPAVAAVADRCFTAGAVTYRVSTGMSTPDYRVRIERGAADPDSGSDPDTAPDLRIQLVDSVESADFALVDGFGGDHGACASASHIRTVQIVGETSAADITLRLAGQPTEADLKLFVRSERFGDRDAAALFAAMLHDQARQKLAQSR